MKKANLINQLLIWNSISLILVLFTQLYSSEIGDSFLSITFLNEDIHYWFARYIQTTAINNICLMIGLLNIGLIVLAIHHLLNSKKE